MKISKAKRAHLIALCEMRTLDPMVARRWARSRTTQWRGGSTVLLAEGASVDVISIDSLGESSSVFSSFFDACDREIAQALLGVTP